MIFGISIREIRMSYSKKKFLNTLQSVIIEPFNQSQKDRIANLNRDSAEHPHWSSTIKEWPRDRFDPISNAPHGSPITIRFTVRVKEFGGFNKPVVLPFIFVNGVFNSITPNLIYDEGVVHLEEGGIIINPKHVEYKTAEWQPISARNNPSREELYGMNQTQIHLLEEQIKFLKRNSFYTLKSFS